LKNSTLLALLVLSALTACGSKALVASSTATPDPDIVQVDEDRSGCVITAPPEELELDPFYVKYCDAQGIPVIASSEVADEALRQGYYLTLNFFASIPEIRATMIARGAMLSIYGANQTVRDVPETYTFSLSNSPGVVGLGGSLSQPVTVTTERDLARTPWMCNSVTIHELGHAIRDIALLTTVRGFLTQSNDIFALAVQEDLWAGSYARTNADEYWAEGVSAYFGAYQDPYGTSYVRDRESLAEYDPRLFTFIESIWNGFAWTATCG
jgi:hypothetical protein